MSPIKSGDRLRARWTSNNAGDVKYFDTWFDVELETTCSWQRVADGYRCVPPVASAVYRDSGCSEPAVLQSSCFPTAYAVLGQSVAPGECTPSEPPPLETIYAVGEAVAGDPTSYWFRGADGQCLEAPIDAQSSLLELGAEVPLSTFAAGERRRDYSGTRLAVDFIRGEDGSQEQFRTFDLELQSPCSPDLLRENPVCLPPTNTFLASYHGQASCEAGSRLAYSFECEPSPIVYDFVSDGACGVTSRYFSRGEVWEGNVYQGTMTTCMPSPVREQLPGIELYEIGASIAEDTFVALEKLPVGEGRIRTTRTSYLGEVEISPRVPPTLLDVELDEVCSILPVSDGSRRCLPVEFASTDPSSASQFWGDGECSNTPLKVLTSPDECIEPPRWLFAEGTLDACGFDVAEVYRRGAAWTGAVFERVGVDCVASTVPVGNTAYELEGPIDPAEFVEFTTVVE